MRRFDLEFEDKRASAGWVEPGLALAGLLALVLFAQAAVQRDFRQAPLSPAVAGLADNAVASARDTTQPMGPVVVLDGRVSIEGTILFPKASASLTDSGSQLLGELVPVLRGMLGEGDDMLMVSGFTDDLGIQTREFPSNWELSAMRATHVVRALVGTGFPEERIFAAAFGENRPQVKNRSEGERARNRRVELVRVPAAGGGKR